MQDIQPGLHSKSSSFTHIPYTLFAANQSPALRNQQIYKCGIFLLSLSLRVSFLCIDSVSTQGHYGCRVYNPELGSCLHFKKLFVRLRSSNKPAQEAMHMPLHHSCTRQLFVLQESCDRWSQAAFAFCNSPVTAGLLPGLPVCLFPG